MRSILIAAALSLTLAAPAVACEGCVPSRLDGPVPTDKDVLNALNSLPFPIVQDLVLTLAAAALAGDSKQGDAGQKIQVPGLLSIPGPAPIDEDVVNAYRLCEADYRSPDSYAGITGGEVEPRYRLEGCNRVLEIYKHEKEVHDKQFIDFVTGHYTGDPVPRQPVFLPAPAVPERHGLTSPK